jgi:hypothetical protein
MSFICCRGKGILVYGFTDWKLFSLAGLLLFIDPQVGIGDIEQVPVDSCNYVFVSNNEKYEIRNYGGPVRQNVAVIYKEEAI